MVRFLIPVTKYWTEIGTSDATHGGEAAQLARAERFGGVGGGGGGGGLRCGNVPVQTTPTMGILFSCCKLQCLLDHHPHLTNKYMKLQNL